MRPALCLSFFVLAFCPAALSAQPKGPKDAVVIFKDGFYIKGKAVQTRDFFVDPHSGVRVTIAKGGDYLYVDDDVRRINFSTAQVQEVLDVEPEALKGDQVNLIRRQPPRRPRYYPLPPGIRFEEIPTWDKKWERTVTGRTERGRLNLVQRLVGITPRFIAGYTVGYDWTFAYQTREVEIKELRRLVLDFLADPPPPRKALTDFERHMVLAKFLAQAGMYDPALHELDDVRERYPDRKDATKYLYEKIQPAMGRRAGRERRAAVHGGPARERAGRAGRPGEASG